MTDTSGADAAPPLRKEPVVNRIALADVFDALAAGLRDFQGAPLYGLFFGGIYAAGGLLIVAIATKLGMSYLTYPTAAGFALIGPFVAVGLYEVSRRREAGLPLSWPGVLGVVVEQSRRELGWMAFVTLFVFVVWMYQVRLLLALFLGFQSFASLGEFLDVLITTPEGLMFLAIGHVIGAILSVVLFSLTVVSFPILLDRDLDFITAMITSVRAVTTNPGPMLAWAAIVVGLLIVSLLPAFLGLLLTLPILGHTTWHLYRKLVAPA